MSSVLFRGGKIITATGISDGEVLTKDGVICEVSLGGKVSGEAEQVINLEGKYLSPGFIDIHTHGAGGSDFMDRTAGALEAKSDNVPPLFRRYVFVGKEVKL